jgi:anti-sigma factor RsiW
MGRFDMIDEKHIELINAEIDGELSSEQRADLSGYLLRHPEARALRDDLQRLCGALNRTVQVPPPADLRDRILGALPAPAPRRHWSAGSSRPVLRYAAVLAGGLLVSAIAFQFGMDGRPGPDAAQVAGTMADPATDHTGAPVGTVRIDTPQVTGRVNLYRAASGLILGFDLAAREPIEVVATCGGREIRFSGLGRPDPISDHRYACTMSGSATEAGTVTLKFYAGGKLIRAEQLEAPAG